MVLSTFRVDTTDISAVQSIIDAYLKLHPSTKYCFNSEISDVQHKHHFQGWFDIPTIKTQATFGNWMREHFNEIELGGHKYSFAKVKDPTTYYAYILNNEMKPETSYQNVHTNYSEEEFDTYKGQKRFVKLPTIQKGRKAITKTYQDKVLDELQDTCVKDGKIQYTKIPSKYLELAPSLQLDKHIARKNALGYTLRLENRLPHPENHRVTDFLFDALQFDDKGLPSIFSPMYEIS